MIVRTVSYWSPEKPENIEHVQELQARLGTILDEFAAAGIRVEVKPCSKKHFAHAYEIIRKEGLAALEAA